MPHVRERIKLIKNQPDWWKNLPRFNLGFKILKIAKDLEFEVYILTKAPKSIPKAWTQKAEWISENVPNIPIVMTQDKGLVYGKVLVDDYPPYIERWLEHRPRGLVIVPAHDYNQSFSHPNSIRYDGSKTQLERIKKAMSIAKQRKPEHPLDLSGI